MSLAILIECRPPACETDKGEEKGSLTQNERGCETPLEARVHTATRNCKFCSVKTARVTLWLPDCTMPFWGMQQWSGGRLMKTWPVCGPGHRLGAGPGMLAALRFYFSHLGVGKGAVWHSSAETHTTHLWSPSPPRTDLSTSLSSPASRQSHWEHLVREWPLAVQCLICNQSTLR